MIGNRPTLRFAAAIAGALLLNGCAFAPQLKRVAVDQNQMVAEIEDELTLLNIVRASHRFPLHFTAVSEVNGNATLNGGVSLDATLESGPNSFGPGGQIGASTSPNFRALVLATEDFQRGIQQPITPETVAYYLDAGWPDHLIMALFVERLDVYDQGNLNEPTHSISNEPEQGAGFGALLCKFGLAAKAPVSSRPLAGFSELIDLDTLAKEGASAADRRNEISAFLKLVEQDGVTLSGDTLFLTGSSNSVVVKHLVESRCDSSGAGHLEVEGAVIIPRFRSTQGVIYFLGEYVRAQRGKGAYLLPFANDECQTLDAPVRQVRPILAVEQGSGPAHVATKFNGTRYFIPSVSVRNCENGALAESRSMQVVAIVQQLINLHKSSDTLPASISVTGVN